MTSLTISNKEYLLVEVPEDAVRFECHHLYRDDSLLICDADHYEEWTDVCSLKGKFEIISLLKDLTEEQAASMVDKVTENVLHLLSAKSFEVEVWRNYDRNEIHHCNTALESFSSFLRSHGVDETRNYLILLKL